MKLTRKSVQTSTGKSTTSVAFGEFNESELFNAVQKNGLVFVRMSVDASEINDTMPLQLNNRSIKLASKKSETGYKEFFVDHYETKRNNWKINSDTKQIVVVINTKLKFEE